MLWAEMAPCPRPARESQSPAEPTQGATYILPTAVYHPWEGFLIPCPSCVCSTFILCASCIPSLSAQGLRGLGGGAAKDTGSALWGPVGQARVGSQPGRKGHSEVGRKAYTPPSWRYPPLPPASKEKGTGGVGGD